MATTPGPAVMYLRQSLNKTGQELAVDRQRDAGAVAFRARGITQWSEYKDDDRSASKQRDDWDRLLKDIKAGQHNGKLLWIAHVDRLLREVIPALQFRELAVEHNIKLLSQSGEMDLESDDGEFMLIILAAVAQKEVRRKGKRQKAANKQMAENDGRAWWPSRPFGYDAPPDPTTGKWWTVRRDPNTKRIIAVNEIAEHATEAPLVREAYRRFNLGTPLRTIASEWNAAEVVTPRGNRWTGTQVRALLLSARNAGLREYGGEVVGRGTWPELVSKAVWQEAVRKLSEPSRGTGAPRARKYLLSGIARCGREGCGQPLGSAISSRGQRQYGCNHCQKLSRDGVKLDELVTEAVVRRLSREDAVDLLRPAVDPVDAEALREERQALKARLTQLGKDFATAPPEFTKAALEEINAKLAEISAALDDPGKAQVFEDLIGVDDVRAAWESLDLGRQRTIVDALMTIRVLPVGKGTGRFFNPEYVELIAR